MPEISTLTEEQRQRIAANKAKAIERLNAKRKEREQEEKKEKPLKKARWIKSYYEYDLSTLVDSKGGFIIEENNTKEEEKKKHYLPEPYYPSSFDSSEAPKCKECNTMDLDSVFFNFDYENRSERAELKDPELLPHWSKPNPHKSTWNDMMLYVREMVEEYAFKKWDGPNGLDTDGTRCRGNIEAEMHQLWPYYRIRGIHY
ncbi:hypothetical protein CU098_013032 [Rhizopus stolonifer]|uniref:XPA C-terminal domain-containing protein n=1 Tax=Rhizopus stolonifer TaxID=4846 RepID=A0A367KV02_RHIST|nr:hypothetical protein CU098_013032 [Rhizopus stolonifer]